MQQDYRDKLIDERFQRDKERIEHHEDHMAEQDNKISDLEKLSIEMGELIKRHDEKIESNSKDIQSLKEQPAKNWSMVVSTIISAVTSGIVAAIIAFFTK